MNILYYTFKNKSKLRILGNIDLFRIVCLVLTGFLMLQVVSPGAAFCLKEGSRIIQCPSLCLFPLAPVVEKIVEPGCCNKTCKEKPSANTQNRSSSNEKEDGSCCISLGGEHERAMCPSFSDFHIFEIVTFFDLIEPFIASNGIPLYRATEKPPSLVALRTIVLIL